MTFLYLTLKPEVYSAKRIAEEASRAGHEVLFLSPDDLQMGIIEEGCRIYRGGKPLMGIDAVIPRLGPTVTDHGLGVLRQFELSEVPTLNSADAICRARDKLVSYQHLGASGIPVPKTLVVRTSAEFRELRHLLPGERYIIKLPVGYQGIGVMLADSRPAAESILDTMWGLRNTVMVQEFLPSAALEDKRVLVLGGEVVAAMTRHTAEGEFRSNLHRSGKGDPAELTQEEREIALKATQVLGLELAGIDLCSSDRGPLVLEANTAPGIEGIERSSGLNVAGRIVCYLGSRPQGPPAKPA